jgi:hypothetical protein
LRACSRLVNRLVRKPRGSALGDQPGHEPRVAVNLDVDERFDAREAANPGKPLRPASPNPQ